MIRNTSMTDLIYLFGDNQLFVFLSYLSWIQFLLLFCVADKCLIIHRMPVTRDCITFEMLFGNTFIC